MPNPHSDLEQSEQAMLASAFAKLDPVALGVALGAVCALGLWFATAALLWQGGSMVGLHLQGLGHYLPGYSVSWGGAFIGAIESALVGFGIGALLAWMWNGYHSWFIALAVARETRRELQEL
jgi:hypothetical protein